MDTKKEPLLKDSDSDDVDVHLYRSMIGSLMYLTSSRPNIMFVVCACARFQVTPKVLHSHAVKRIFRYLKGQPNLGLWYPRNSPFDLVAYSNSDYARASLDRKSTMGGCQFLLLWTSTLDSESNAGLWVSILQTYYKSIDVGRKVLELGTAGYVHIEYLVVEMCGDDAVYKIGDRMERAATTASSLEQSGRVDTILGGEDAQTRIRVDTAKHKLNTAHNKVILSAYPSYSWGNPNQTSLQQMANLDFCDMHNMVAYLQKSEGSEGFHQIVDFLNSIHIKLCSHENPTIKSFSHRKYFGKPHTLHSTLENGDMEITATIDGKFKIVSEASIRRHLKLKDSNEQFWQTATAPTLENGDMEITTTIDRKVKIVSEVSVRRHLKLEDSDGISTLPTTNIF
ncbi:hypothetical protein Tco_0047358 [Tanacetum coccineum]